ncbi:MAG: type III-B CRISPR module RAMP protein Cmr4 [bacterium]
MNSTILGLLAETSIHPGAGQDTGFLDLPVAREAATDYPVIVGSSLKGALRDLKYQSELILAKKDADDDEKPAKDATDRTEAIFGRQESAGNVLVSDARLVLLPVRSLTSHYKWITCPHLLERLQRDLKRANCNGQPIGTTGPEKGYYLGNSGDGGNLLLLEERQFTRTGELPERVVETLTALIAHQDSTAKRLRDQLVVLHNDDLAWFARYGLAVNARNVLDDVNKTSKNLWYEETIPPDSLFYCLLAERADGALDELRKLFDQRPYLQVGGNETVGQGWMAIRDQGR